jgi:hypothetical protein
MKSLKTFIKEEEDLDGHADVLNDDIEELYLRVVNSEDVLGKLDDIAFMVNKGRLYSATVPLSVLDDIWIKMQQWEERFIVWEKPKSDKQL